MADNHTPDPGEDLVEERQSALFDTMGISELDYPSVLEAAIAHATASGRPALVAPDPLWTSVGPRNLGGRIISIAQDITDPLILYAGSAHGGLWRTVDAGDTWEQLGQPEHSFPIGAIGMPEKPAVPLPNPTSVFYIGTGELLPGHVSGRGLFMVVVPGPSQPAQFFRLSDAPNGRQPPANNLNGAAMRYTRIQVDPDEPFRFWAASQTGVWQCKTAMPVLGSPASPVNPARNWTLYTPSPLPTAVDGSGNWPSYATDVRVARDPDKPENLLIYAAIFGKGVFRAKYTRSTDTVGDWTDLKVPFPAGFARIQIALCKRLPKNVYASAALPGGAPSPVFRSNNGGDDWTQGAQIPNPGTQAWYDFVLECNPDNPNDLICGTLDVSKSEDAGATWTPILRWQNYDAGDYAQHADQHAAIFDNADRRKLWIGNDGGLSLARDLSAFPESPRFWRKRSHGICAAQFQDITTHPLYDLSFIAAGGLQDNGTWVGYGGPTWYHIGFADGAGTAIHSGNPRQFVVGQDFAVNLNTMAPIPAGFFGLTNPTIPELPESFAPNHAMTVRVDGYAAAAGQGPFVPVLEQHPLAPGQILVGWDWNAGAGAGAALALTGAPPPAAVPPAAPIPVTLVAANGLPASTPGAETTAVAFGLGSNNPLLQILITTAGPLGTARFEVHFWLGTAFGGAVGALRTTPATAGLVHIPECLFPINFGAGGYIANDSWTVSSNGTVQPKAGNTSTGAITATAWLVEGWMGNNRNQVFWTPDSSLPGVAWTQVATWPAAPGGFQRQIARFAVHPTDPRIVAVASNPASVLIPVNLTVTMTAPAVAAGPLQFTVQFGPGPALPATNFVARFDIPNTLTTLYFTAPMASYAAGDTWTVDANDTVSKTSGGAAGTMSAITRPGGRVFITYDRGVNWTDISFGSEAGGPLAQPDLKALPPCPVPSLKFDLDSANILSLYAGTLAGVYVYPNVPTPQTIAITPSPVNIKQGETLQLKANLTLSGGGAALDATTQVDWFVDTAGFTIGAQNGQLKAPAGAAAGTTFTVTARRGVVTGTANGTVVAGAAGAVPGPPAAMPAPPVPAVNWRPFNNGLPLTLINDMELIAMPARPAVPLPAAPPPAPTPFRFLRVATFGRGIWDCYLDGGAAVFLYTRQTLIEDGRRYPRTFPAALPDDPRLAPGTVGFDFAHAFDIRTDAAPFNFFDDQLDGVEFDEQLGVDDLVPLVSNAIYVQVLNRGTNAADVNVHLYFVASPAPAPLAAVPPVPIAPFMPAAVAALKLNFDANFDPPAAAAAPDNWKRVAPKQAVKGVSAAQPRVTRFDWTPPKELAGKDVALLSLCVGAAAGADAGPPISIGAGVTLGQLIQADRHAALRVIKIGALPPTNLYIRDGVDDEGGTGEFVFGGRSPDIVCISPSAVDPVAKFADLLDQRPQDRITSGATNHVYVRVFNRGLLDAVAQVRIWAVPLDATNLPAFTGITVATNTPPASWIQLTPDVVGGLPVGQANVPAKGNTFFHVSWPNPPAPANSNPTYRAYAIVVIIQSVDNLDPLPPLGRITSLVEFWKFFRSYADSDNAASRVYQYI